MAPEDSRVDQDLLTSALNLAGRGWLVFPCVPDAKRPALRRSWQSLATTDERTVRAWWAREPYNIGIACGPSGLVVVDLDMLRGERPGEPPTDTVNGAAALAALCRECRQPYPLPTYTVDTPSGGCHLYYAAGSARVRNSAGLLGPLIDIRAGGGYVIGAGSRIGDRRYIARNALAPMPLPAWLSRLLQNDSSLTVASRLSVPDLDGAQGPAYAMAALREETRLVTTAQPGRRNDTLNRAAFNLGQLAAVGLLPPLAVASALADAAGRAGLPADEARRTIRSGMSAGGKKPRW
jgi:hypothetical protein